MKKLTILLFFAISIFNFSCARRTTGVLPDAENHPLVGTWILVSSNNSSPGGEFFRLDKTNTRQMKILNPTHFMFIQENINGDDYEFESAAGGRYELDGNTYIETLDFASWENYRNSYAVFTWRLEDGKWYHTGVLNQPDGEKFLIEEIWERVDTDD